eukprot:1978097-Pleurochrysis_carterae.AAC.6
MEEPFCTMSSCIMRRAARALARCREYGWGITACARAAHVNGTQYGIARAAFAAAWRSKRGRRVGRQQRRLRVGVEYLPLCSSTGLTEGLSSCSYYFQACQFEHS